MDNLVAGRLLQRGVNGDCTKDTCPASDSIYGYAPSYGFNLFFTFYFGILTLVFYHQTLFYPRWRSYSIAGIIGCAMESGGYGGRILLHFDPFSGFGFKLNVTLLTVAPAFLSASIYLTLKVATKTFGQHLSRLPPAWYAIIFVSCDMVSILLQGAGGAISAIAEKKKLLDMGVDVMMAGLAFQVFTLLVFAALVLEYFWRCRKNQHGLAPGSPQLASSNRFQFFAAAMAIAYLVIFIRCVYRLAELWGGWGNAIMRKEAEFIILDSDMCTLAATMLCFFHPQWFFRVPQRVEFNNYPMKLDVEGSAARLSRIDLIKNACNSALRVTLNDSLTGWEKAGVRSVRGRT